MLALGFVRDVGGSLGCRRRVVESKLVALLGGTLLGRIGIVVGVMMDMRLDGMMEV